MSTNPLLYQECVTELTAIHHEVSAMVVGLRGHRAQGAALVRAMYLRQRYQALTTTIRSIDTFDRALDIAYQERTGHRYDEDLGVASSEDFTRAREILAIFGLGPAGGSNQQDVGVKN